MSDSTHRAPPDKRRRQAILWTAIGAIVVITLVLLAFCASTSGDDQAGNQGPGAGPPSSVAVSPPVSVAPSPLPSSPTRRTAVPGATPSATSGAASSPSGGATRTNVPGDAPSTTSTRTSTPVRASSATASPTSTRVAPRGGADTGGGSSITGENTIFTALGVITLLAAIGAAVVATRPRRRP
jgi:hypothetical protein